MRSSVISSVLLSAAVALLSGSHQAQAASDLRVIPRSAEGLEKRVTGSPYNIAGAAAAHQDHRRHHSKRDNSKRAACAARANKSTTTSKKVAAAYSEPQSDSSSSSNSSSSSSSTSTSDKSSSTSTSNSSSDSSSDDVSPIATDSDSSSSSTSASGSVSGFSGSNSGIGSWFRTNQGSDSTNGMSWCETKYQDDWPCFAPSVGTMLSGYSDRQSAAKAYCGREAKVTNTKTGSSATMFICDGFDDKWVKTPGSIDLTVGAFTTLNGGSFDNNKNTVLQVTWELTGNVNEQGTFQKNKYSK